MECFSLVHCHEITEVSKKMLHLPGLLQVFRQINVQFLKVVHKFRPKFLQFFDHLRMIRFSKILEIGVCLKYGFIIGVKFFLPSKCGNRQTLGAKSGEYGGSKLWTNSLNCAIANTKCAPFHDLGGRHILLRNVRSFFLQIFVELVCQVGVIFAIKYSSSSRIIDAYFTPCIAVVGVLW